MTTILFAAEVRAERARARPSMSTSSGKSTHRFSFFAFQAVGMMAKQDIGGQASTFQVSWAPQVPVYGMAGLRLDIGGSLLRGIGGATFLETHYELLLTLTPARWITFEIGGGQQNWKDNGGTHNALSTYVVWNLPGPLFLWADRLVLGYTKFYLSAQSATHEYKAGVRINL